MEKILVYFAIKYNGDWDKIYRAINQKEKVDIESLNDLIKQHGEKYITLFRGEKGSLIKSLDDDKKKIKYFKKFFAVLTKEERTEIILSLKDDQKVLYYLKFLFY